MNWREWVYSTLSSDAALLEVVPIGSMYGAGSVGDRPENKPFIIIRLSPSTRVNSFWSDSNVVVWVHDDPGDYARIDQVIDLCRRALDKKIPGRPGGIVAEWTGDSADLADDGYGTITRNTSYRLVSSEEPT